MPRETEQKNKIAKMTILVTDPESPAEYLASEEGVFMPSLALSRWCWTSRAWNST